MWYAPSAVITGQQYHKPCSERKRTAKTISSCCVCLCYQLQSLTCKISHQLPTERPESHSRYKNQYKAASQWGQIMDSHQDVKCVVSRPPHTPLPISDHFPAVPSKCFSFAVCSSCPCFSSQVFPIFFTTLSAYTVPSLNIWISGFFLTLSHLYLLSLLKFCKWASCGYILTAKAGVIHDKNYPKTWDVWKWGWLYSVSPIYPGWQNLKSQQSSYCTIVIELLNDTVIISASLSQ